MFFDIVVKCLENDIGEISNYDIGNIIYVGVVKKERKRERGREGKGRGDWRGKLGEEGN